MSVGRPAQTSREEIVRAARRIFQQAGLEGLSVRGVASAVQTAPSTIYNYFGTKRGLLTALADDMLLEVRPRIDQEEDPLTALRRWIFDYRQLLLKTPDLIELANTHGPSASVFRVGHDVYVLLQRAGFSDRDAALHARTLHCMVNGVVLQEIRQKNLGDNLLGMMPAEYLEAMRLVSQVSYDQLFANTIELSLDGLKAQLARA